MMKAVAVAMAAQIMRRILLDQARRRVAAKRGGNVERVNLDGLPDIGGGRRGSWVGCTFSVVREFKMEIPTLKFSTLILCVGLVSELELRCPHTGEGTRAPAGLTISAAASLTAGRECSSFRVTVLSSF
jgi:hypothetical protein